MRWVSVGLADNAIDEAFLNVESSHANADFDFACQSEVFTVVVDVGRDGLRVNLPDRFAVAVFIGTFDIYDIVGFGGVDDVIPFV